MIIIMAKKDNPAPDAGEGEQLLVRAFGFVSMLERRQLCQKSATVTRDREGPPISP